MDWPDSVIFFALIAWLAYGSWLKAYFSKKVLDRVFELCREVKRTWRSIDRNGGVRITIEVPGKKRISKRIGGVQK